MPVRGVPGFPVTFFPQSLKVISDLTLPSIAFRFHTFLALATDASCRLYLTLGISCLLYFPPEVADDDCKILPGVPQHLRTYVPVTDYLNLGDLIHHLPFPRVHASPQHTPTLHTRATYPPHRDVPLPKHPQPSTPPTQAPRTSNLRTIWPTFECTPFTPSHSPNSVLNIANHRIAFAQPDDDLHLA
ncbi:hypothetical protein CTAM01_14659 [Colletotrichum tamarilloi]|uniref:Uncharacterized protein n=1 Tax=Colletotrichum tamarilloi TaxID=1209934 RepID=A0ABQ9QNI5_9PEZI|nr:uncharacterized protein CTAM01_14659 [Colletotrichum tamarilloi]KAK1479377.1 hypothetical protein CTAM01_14659 [Colletotrichum tamarilloi]